jgi:hypothetical protein
MPRFRLPEIILGFLLAVALVAIGLTLFQWPQFSTSTAKLAVSQPSEQSRHPEKPDQELTGSAWLTKDAAGFFTFLLAAVGSLQLCMFFFQLRYMRESMDDAKMAAEAAKESALAARDSIALARNTAERQMRAYIHTQNVESYWTAEKFTETLTKWTFFPVWKNSGATWPVNLISAANLWIGENARLPMDFDFPDYALAQRGIVGPNAIMHGSHFDISVERLQKIRAGSATAYLWGWVEYNDVFDNKRRHRSEFCFQIEVTGNPIYKEGGFRYATYGPFNGYDDECYRKPSQPF